MHRTLTLATLALAMVATLTACFTVGPQTALSGFRFELPASASERQVIPVSVVAVGSDGSLPFAGFGGEARLSVSRGTIAPDRLAFEAGRATAEVVLRGALGAVEVTITGGGATGTQSIELVVLTALPGDPDGPAADAIPEIGFEPRAQDYRDDHPDLAGAFLSFNTLLAVFDLDATVAEVNAVLAGAGAEIVAGVPGRAGQAAGIVFLRVATSAHEELGALLEELRANPLVEHVVQDSLLESPPAEATSADTQIALDPVAPEGEIGEERAAPIERERLPRDAVEGAGRTEESDLDHPSPWCGLAWCGLAWCGLVARSGVDLTAGVRRARTTAMHDACRTWFMPLRPHGAASPAAGAVQPDRGVAEADGAQWRDLARGEVEHGDVVVVDL